MNTNLVYEMHEMTGSSTPPGRFGMVQPYPGGLLLVTCGMNVEIPIEEPDDQLVDDESNGYLEINTSKGRFLLNRIDRDAAEEMAPFYSGIPAEIASDAEAQAIFRKLLLGTL